MMNVGGVDVSRETYDKLLDFSAQLLRWTGSINLIASSTLDDIWDRHVADSAQLWSLLPSGAGSWVDLGSGGGLPGLVVAILAAEHHPDMTFVLVESDQRKVVFLRRMVGHFALGAKVHATRAEKLPPQGADVVSARAMAPLSALLKPVSRHLAPGGQALLPKGARWAEERDAALAQWRFECDTYPSRTDPRAAILSVRNIRAA